MLGNLKKKLSNAIQESMVISESIQHQYRQRVSTPSSPTTPTANNTAIVENLSSSSLSQLDIGAPSKHNIAAGCNLLAKYEDDWQKIHIANEENATKAATAAKHIAEIERRATAQRVAITDLITCLSGLPALVKKLNESLDTLQQIKTLSAQVEEELENLEDLCSECELQELMLEKQCEFSQHKQMKLAKLEAYRAKIALEHQAKIREHEEHLKQIQRERQAVFDDAFRDDVAEYKEKGTLTKIQKEQNNQISLEEVELVDNETKDALEEFLNDDS